MRLPLPYHLKRAQRSFAYIFHCYLYPCVHKACIDSGNVTTKNRTLLHDCTTPLSVFITKSRGSFLFFPLKFLNFKYRIKVKWVENDMCPKTQVYSRADHDYYSETWMTEYNKRTFVKKTPNKTKTGKQTNLIFKCITWRRWLRGHRVLAAPGATDETTWHICSFPGSCRGCGTAVLGSRERLWAALCSPLWQSKPWLHLDSR